MSSIRNLRLAIIDAAQEESWNQLLDIDQQLRNLLEGGQASGQMVATEQDILELGRILECYQNVIEDLRERQQELSKQADSLGKAKRGAISYLSVAK
ncbi:MAG: hypothetical protein OIF35_07120 [Cellvibrionaceae bacterium]|nr:hypothetical protein [Cellvibrionaceae bacterium]MCV6625940.1 hypothetical protein [Cellvibrionaceae bacterium]